MLDFCLSCFCSGLRLDIIPSVHKIKHKYGRRYRGVIIGAEPILEYLKSSEAAIFYKYYLTVFGIQLKNQCRFSRVLLLSGRLNSIKASKYNYFSSKKTIWCAR